MSACKLGVRIWSQGRRRGARTNRFDVSCSGETTTIDRHSRAHEIQVEGTLHVHSGCVKRLRHSGKIRASLMMAGFKRPMLNYDAESQLGLKLAHRPRKTLSLSLSASGRDACIPIILRSSHWHLSDSVYIACP